MNLQHPPVPDARYHAELRLGLIVHIHGPGLDTVDDRRHAWAELLAARDTPTPVLPEASARALVVRLATGAGASNVTALPPPHPADRHDRARDTPRHTARHTARHITTSPRATRLALELLPLRTEDDGA